jgi:hypothetical protein
MKKKHKSSSSFKVISIFSIILFGMSTPADLGAECREFTFNGWISGKGMEWPSNVEVLATMRIDTAGSTPASSRPGPGRRS